MALFLCRFTRWDYAEGEMTSSYIQITNTQYKRTAVLQAVLLDRHLLCQLGQRLVDGVAAPQRLRKSPLEPLHLLQGALGKGRPKDDKKKKK